MHLTIRHTTRYVFDNPANYGLQQLRKIPKSNALQTVLSWDTRIEGGKRELTFEDHHHNTVELISFDRQTQELVITSDGSVEMTEAHGVVGAHRGPAPLWLYRRPTPATFSGAGVRGLLKGLDGDTELERMHALSAAIRDQVSYRIGASEPDWSAEDALSAGAGVCQDHAHIFIAAAREMGLPARYVSGYLMLNDRQDQEAMHAWAEVHLDDLGWVGFDVSNGISPDTRYVRVATGLDYRDAAPITGTQFGGAGEALTVEIEVAQQ
jgi:transglutaminase-like putative cysteine protease